MQNNTNGISFPTTTYAFRLDVFQACSVNPTCINTRMPTMVSTLGPSPELPVGPRPVPVKNVDKCRRSRPQQPAVAQEHLTPVNTP